MIKLFIYAFCLPLQAGQINSSIEIQYALGRDHYRFVATSQNSSIVANTFLNRQVLDTGPIDSNRYPLFLKRVSDFISQIKKDPIPRPPCRSPFRITVKIGSEIHIASGCRSTNGGELSKLVRDGEFLLYSKNECEQK